MTIMYTDMRFLKSLNHLPYNYQCPSCYLSDPNLPSKENREHYAPEMMEGS